MKCEQKGCDKEAMYEVFWPGKTVKQCDEHTKQLRNLGGVMGFFVDARLIPLTGAEMLENTPSRVKS